MTLFELAAKITLDDKSFNQGVDNAKDAFGGLSAWTIAKAQLMADAIKKVSSAVVNIGRSAIDAYANYEQLVGGVETLFGTNGLSIEEFAKKEGKTVEAVSDEYNKLVNAQNTVMQNAKNAYKNAGMSANAYMETVTSFAASLTQSLGGDTEKAVAVADMAINDMSDNANKMGTNIQSIQNAYQGFAKQNYTMLDNLKLGYGGTKSEMERLLADAQRLKRANGEMVTYTIGNYADMVEAIHVVQENMGITGTTAKEAASTIQGSAGMAKAAWQNLLVGLADDSADLQELLQVLLDSVTTAAGNILPRVGVFLENIGQVMRDNGPMLLEKGMQLLTEFIMGLVEKAPEAYEFIKQLVITMGSKFVENAPRLIGSILALIGVITAEVMQAIIDFGSWALMKVWDGIVRASVAFWDNLVKKWEDFKADLGKKFGELVDSAKTWGSDMIGGFIDGITEKAQALWDKVTETANGIKRLLHFSRPDEGPLRDYETWMPDFMKGLASGISRNKHLVVDEIKSLTDDMQMGDITAKATAKYDVNGDNNGRSAVNVVQNIYSQAKTAADLMQEAIYQQKKAVLLGV